MSHKLERLLGSKINNVPALITEDHLRELVGYMQNRETPHTGISQEDTYRRQMAMTDDLAMIPITGTLSYETTFMSALCGMTSYQKLLSDVEKAAKLGIKTFVFDANSGGGEAYAMMDTANSIRKVVDNVGGKIITYVDGTCASACFGLAAISDEIIAHPDARTGSVGVVVRLVNDNKAMKDKGYETSYITSAKSKVPFDKEGSFKQDFLEDIQSQVDKLHTKFATHIAEYRNMSLEDVNSTEAKVFDSDKALDIGFIDKIMDHGTFYEYLETINEDKNMPLTLTNSKDMNLEQEQETLNMDTEKFNALQEQLQSTEAQKTELAEQLAEKSLHIEQLNTQLVEVQTALSKLTEKAENDKLASRKASLSEYLAEDQLEGVFSAVSGLPDASFEVVLASYKATALKEESTPDFNELGVSGESEAHEDELSGVMNLIKANKKV